MQKKLADNAAKRKRCAANYRIRALLIQNFRNCGDGPCPGRRQGLTPLHQAEIKSTSV